MITRIYLQKIIPTASRYIFLLIYLKCNWLPAQTDNLYRIYLLDKKGSLPNRPEEYLSARALERRQRYHIPLNEQDVPISKQYLDSLAHLGLKIVCTSRWMNTVVVSGIDALSQERVKKFKFVKQIIPIADTLHRKQKQRLTKFYVPAGLQQAFVAELLPQLTLNRGNFLHEKGYYGNGIWIAVIDAGFKQAPACIALNQLYSENRLLGTRNFVFPDSGVYTASLHGTAVLSIMAASGTDSLIGTAPLASYLLLRSEDVGGEYPAEEDFWVAAAEYADSMGVDIINTSLGYTEFDNPAYNYRYSDMNGITAFISQAASIAAAKGMLVVVSAGNDGNAPWHYIGAPADAKGILAVGALESNGMRATFSSVGPSADGRVKPEIMAMGKQVRAEYAPGNFRPVSGTSFSAPIISGLAACLWEAFPQLPATKIREAIIRSSSLYDAPDSLMGYGIPNFSYAFAWLQQNKNNENQFAIYPNPCRNNLTIEWYNPDKEPLLITCITLTGQTIFLTHTVNTQKILLNEEIQNIPAGLYVLLISRKNQTFRFKFLKM